jgi:hypothetical protein
LIKKEGEINSTKSDVIPYLHRNTVLYANYEK